LSPFRGFRHGIVTAVRVRLPYIFHAAIYVLLFRDRSVVTRLRFVVKQMFFHGRNLGAFVLIYKSICCLLRNMNIDNGLESWIAGLVGGYYAFGEKDGISGSVNNQLVLYLLARGIQGGLKGIVNRGLLPASVDPYSKQGFRYFAAFSLALALYLTEHEPETLTQSFMATMRFLYYESDHGPAIPRAQYQFLPVFIIILISLLGYYSKSLTLENLLSVIDYP